MNKVANIRVRIPIQDFHPSSRLCVSKKMTVGRFVASSEHNAETAQLDIGLQHLAETLLVQLDVAGDRDVSNVPRAAEKLVETGSPRMRREPEQSGTNRGRPERGTNTAAVATNPFIRGKAKHHDLGCVPGPELAAQKPPYPWVIRRCFRLNDLSWNESCHTSACSIASSRL